MSRRDVKDPPRIEGMVSIKVDNIPQRMDPADLRDIFSRFGDIGDVHIPKDTRSGENKGFGFVRFFSIRDADDAIDRMDGRIVFNRELKVTRARYGRPCDERAWRRFPDNDRFRRRRSRSLSRGRSRSPQRRRRRSSPRRSPSPAPAPRNRRPQRSPSRSRTPSVGRGVRRRQSGAASRSPTKSPTPAAAQNGCGVADKSRHSSHSRSKS